MDVAAEIMGLPMAAATLTVNLLGCFLMGALVAFVLAHPGRHPLWRPFLGVGLLGGFTTFSAFAADAVLIAGEGAWAVSTAYVAATLIGGLLALWLGYAGGATLRRGLATGGMGAPP
jgi:CrcB protein